MEFRPWGSFGIWLVLAFVGIFADATASAQDNLVRNPGFLPGPSCEGTWSDACARGFAGYIPGSNANMAVALEDANHILLFSLTESVSPALHASAIWSTSEIAAGSSVEITASHRAREWKAESQIRIGMYKGDSLLSEIIQPAPSSATVWTRVGAVVETPDGTDRLDVSLEILGACDEAPCGDVSFDDLSVVEKTEPSAYSSYPYQNICPEGQFLNLSSGVCLPRETERGFSFDDFDSAVYADLETTVTSCTENGLRSAIDRVKNRPGGGTIHVPACTIQVRERVDLPSNILLQGAGVGRSIIRSEDGCAYDADEDPKVLHIFKQEHIIVRDITLSAFRCAEGPIDVVFSNNVLLERVELSEAQLNGVAISFSRGVTVRYSTAHHTLKNNGILSKDCFLRGSETYVTETTCKQRTLAAGGGSVDPGSLFTENYSVYSNHTFDNAEAHGLALHATFGEVAGNLIERNERGVKMPDSRQVIVHHNRIQFNDLWGIQIYSPIVDRPPQNITLARNEFFRNGHIAARLTGVKGVYLAQNIYRENNQCYGTCWAGLPKGGNGLLVKSREFDNGVSVEADVYICKDSQDATLEVFGGGNVTVITGGVCDGLGENTAPVARDDTVTVFSGAPTTLLVTANDLDLDGDALLVSGIVDAPNHGEARRDGNSVVYTATKGYAGVDRFTYQLADAFGATDEADVTITVLPAPNAPPVAVTDSFTVVTATGTFLSVLDNDSDPSAVGISINGISVGPVHGSATIDDEWVVYTSDEGYEGADRLTYEIVNVFGKTDTAGVVINVIPPPNSEPLARKDSASTIVNTWTIIDVLANDTDPDGDTLRLDAIVRRALNGDAVILDSQVTYSPNDNFSGTDAFRYSVVDGRGGYAEAIVTISVINANDAQSERPGEEVVIWPAYPNPARQSVTLAYSLGSVMSIDAVLYDLLGKEVKRLHTGYAGPGEQQIRFDVSSLSTGIYFIRFQTSDRLHVYPIEVVR